MEANECNTNHLDADVRLPPRKRLLAGLKKQSCSGSTSQCSQENNSSPSPSPSPNPSVSPLSEFDVRLNNLLKSYKNGSNMSPEEIAEAAGSAAAAAAKAAEAARAGAEEKASIAAKAVAAAKSALDLVASISEDTSSKDKFKKNKLKKHVPVQLLYKKYQPIENCGTDEELARRLHRAMNSSPRISKPSPGSDSKNHKSKKLRVVPPSEKSGSENGTSLRDVNAKLLSVCDNVIVGGMDCEGSNEEPFMVKVDDKVLKSTKSDEIEVNSRETESTQSKEKTFEVPGDICVNGRKRGRIKQKKLSLSICSSKDQSNSKLGQNLMNPLLTRPRTEKHTVRHVSLLSLEPPAENATPIEVTPTWKCQDFKVSPCLKQDKVVQL